MPFLLRIILQRVLLFIYSILVFLGFAPEFSIISEQTAIAAAEDRRQVISDIVTPMPDESRMIENVTGTTEGLVRVSESPVTPPIIPTPQPSPEPATTEQVPSEPTPELPLPIPTAPDPAPTIPETEISQRSFTVHDVVVNTICTRKSGNMISVSTGSGVLISGAGVVLTNAHVAQLFLLQDHDRRLIDCAIYRENVPTFGFKAEVLYISPKWIEENFNLISNSSARGTGEGDYALLFITGNTNPVLSVPSSFPSANLEISRELKAGQNVLATGYPGGPKNLFEITQSGQLRSEVLTILDTFTFGGGDTDILTTSRTSVGAKGASGGGIFWGSDQRVLDLIGIVATTDGPAGDAKINAITTSYINRNILTISGNNLNYYLSGNLQSKSKNFKDENMSGLVELLLRSF